jgi:pimeloyl-ACP methyl ester carboxylesterase
VRSVFRPAQPGLLAPTRMVWLPGAFHNPEDFVAAGFDVGVRRRGMALDLEFVHVELEHVGDRGALDKLHTQIVGPARAGGCRSVWLAGISLGGFFALDYAVTHEGEWDGLCLLAPYLGNRLLLDEIAQAGDPTAWQAGPLAEGDEERRIWRFIQAQRAEGARRPLYLGYGCGDRFAHAHRLMAQALPPDAVHVAPGGHDWPTWVSLWEQFLDSRYLGAL